MTRREFIQNWNKYSQDICFYCGSSLTDNHANICNNTEEHVYPRHSHRGLKDNVVRACAGCNGAKGGYSPEEFREWYHEPDFFCEMVLGEKIPPLDHEDLHWIVEGMLSKFHQKNLRNIRERFEAKNAPLKQRLRRITGPLLDQTIVQQAIEKTIAPRTSRLNVSAAKSRSQNPRR